jgi:hypothetical protein
VIKLNKDDIALKLDNLIGREVKLADKIKHSSNWVDGYENHVGILKKYDLGEEYEDIIALIQVTVVTGKKKENRRTEEIWVDARDIVGILEKKARKTTNITKSDEPKPKTTRKKKIEHDINLDDWSGDYV